MPSRTYAKVTPKNARFNSKQNTAMLSALSGLYTLVKSWVWVANSAGQASQRTPSYNVKAVVKIAGRKNPLTVEMPVGFQVAYNPDNGSQRKGDMTRWLTALKIGSVENFPRVAELYAEHITFFGYKLLTSQDTSREGCLMASILNHLEIAGHGQLMSLQYSTNDTIERGKIVEVIKNRMDFSKRAIEGKFWQAKNTSRHSTKNLGDIVI